MANDKFVMSSRQVAELDHAFERNKLTPADVKTLSSGDLLGKVLGVIRGAMEIVPRKLPTWRTITIGAHSSLATLGQSLANGGFRVSDFANRLLGKMKLVRAAKKLELVVVTVAELGFPNGATFAQIVKVAKQLGLSLCPAEVGPALRLDYKDQPNGEWLRIAMKPVTDSGGGLRVFGVGHDSGGLWLGTLWFRPECVWGPGARWVFVRSRK